MTTRKLIIFTDLDGTLLTPKTYSFEPAQPTLDLIKQKGIPLVLSSSKTRAEIELYRKKLENRHPFISENGGAVFIPVGYFSFRHPYDREGEGYFVLELGIYHPKIVEVLESIKKETGIQIKGFSELTEQEICSFSGLSLGEATLAKRREYDEPFLLNGGEKEVEIVKRKIKEKGMNYTWGGKFHHILGKNDKGRAVEILKELYEDQFFSISTIGIGDSLNDIPMLVVVDHPILLEGKSGFSVERLPPIQNLTLVEGTGPQAWNEAVLRIVTASGT
jgi:mannosyl-3-phosphoglycerate phosphatase